MNLDLYNSPFDNFVQRTYQPQTPQNRLQIAYEQAMSRRTPEWARTVSDMMPSLAEIGAYFGTKGAFNQGRIADSLEREKQRRTAYNQMMRENEEKQAKDYIQQAKEQLGLATAEDDRKFNREQTALDRAYKKAIDDRNWTNTLEQQDIANKLNQDKLDFAKEQAAQNQKNADREYNLKLSSINNKSADLTPEEKLAWKIKEEDAIANAKAKRDAQQDLNKAIAGQQAFENNIKHLEDLSKKSGTVGKRAIGGVAGLFTGKDTSLTRANNAMDELVSQVRQAALTASGISGESDDKAQQAKLKDIYERAGVPMNAKSLTQAQVGSIINNIKNIYKQRVAEKQSLLDSFNENNENQDNNFSVSWGN